MFFCRKKQQEEHCITFNNKTFKRILYVRTYTNFFHFVRSSQMKKKRNIYAWKSCQRVKASWFTTSLLLFSRFWMVGGQRLNRWTEEVSLDEILRRIKLLEIIWMQARSWKSHPTIAILRSVLFHSILFHDTLCHEQSKAKQDKAILYYTALYCTELHYDEQYSRRCSFLVRLNSKVTAVIV